MQLLPQVPYGMARADLTTTAVKTRHRYKKKLRCYAVQGLIIAIVMIVTSHPLFVRAAHLIAKRHNSDWRLRLRVHDIVGGGPHEVRCEGRATPRHVEHEPRWLQVALRVSVDFLLLLLMTMIVH